MRSPLSIHVRQSHSRGFTLIELLLVVSILGVLLTGGIAGFNDYNNGQTVKQAALTVRNNLRYAQTKAQAADRPCSGTAVLLGYEVSFYVSPSAYYTIRARCSNGLAGTTITTTLPTGVTFSSYPSPLLFQVLTRGVNISAQQNIVVSGFGGSKQATVQVYPSGDVSITYP